MLWVVTVTGDTDGTEPGWWPYAGEFSGWKVWRGVDRLYYASLRDADPPVRVRGEDAVDLRDQIRAVILRSPG
jgi:hypothetical protein